MKHVLTSEKLKLTLEIILPYKDIIENVYFLFSSSKYMPPNLNSYFLTLKLKTL